MFISPGAAGRRQANKQASSQIVAYFYSMLRRLLTTILLAVPLLAGAASEEDTWTLERCVAYALTHNISIQQSVLNERLAALALKQSRLSQLPNANLSTGYGISYGRSIDPTTNQFVDGHYNFSSVGGQADVLIFGWFQKRNTIAKNDLLRQAAQADLDQLKDDVSLNVATGFLRALLAKEQIGVAQKQVDLSAQQLSQTQRFAEAGRLPQLNVAQLRSQVATDSSTLISAISDYTAAILDLKALLNLDFETPFSVTPPQIDVASLTELANYAPAAVYTEALKHFGAVKGAGFRVESAQKAYQAYRGALLPQLTLNAQVGSNFATTYKDYGTPYIKDTQTVGFVDVGGFFSVPVNAPNYAVPVLNTTPYNTQLGNNLRQTYSINLTIPVFNAWTGQAAARQSKISVASQELAKYNTELKLKQDVYKASSDARNALQKYGAAGRAAEAAAEAFSFAQKRYDLGLTNTVEYLVIQNNQFRADAALANAKYDLMFRLKVIDYYLGRTLRL